MPELIIAPAESTAGATNPPDPEIRIETPSFEFLNRNLLQVRIVVRYWRGRERLGLVDLGLDEAPEAFRLVASEYLALGTSLLAPAATLRRFGSLREAARDQAAAIGIRSPFGGYLIPRARYLQFREGISRIQRDFEHEVEQFIEEREHWIAQVIAAMRERETTAHAVRAGLAVIHGLSDDAGPRDLDAFLLDLQERIPGPDALRERFSFDWWVARVQKPPALDAMLSNDELERALEQNRRELDALERAKIVSRESLEEISSEAYQARMESRLRLESERERLESERALALDAQEQKQRAWTSQFEDLTADIAARTRQVILSITQGILGGKSEGNLRGRQLEAIRGLAHEIRALNVGDDEELSRIQAHLVSLTGAEGSEARVGSEALRDAMTDLQTYAVAGLQALGRPVRTHTGKDLDLGTVDVEAFQQARRRITEPVDVGTLELPDAPRRRQGRSQASAPADAMAL